MTLAQYGLWLVLPGIALSPWLVGSWAGMLRVSLALLILWLALWFGREPMDQGDLGHVLFPKMMVALAGLMAAATALRGVVLWGRQTGWSRVKRWSAALGAAAVIIGGVVGIISAI